ncbi:acyltransferase family protein [Nocardioides psychrotolerans]|uniref:acyltransferase family protein n=1 Tax=Nocardioides psychrotolerans TaxID=1005945 RepID=UPI00313834AA
MASRDPWFDNAKMALVTLVVVGHAWTLLPLSGTVGYLYDFLYAWHVPAFVFVTGYLSRSFSYAPERMWQLVRTVAVPYLVFECSIALFRVYVGGEELEDLFLDPHWPLWYLSALFFWRLLTPVFKPMPGGYVVALGISLVAGLFAGDELDLARILGLLPFFVLGLKATPERLERLRTRPVQVVAAVFFVALVSLTWLVERYAATEWLYYRARYDELDVSDLQAFLIRAVLLVVGTVGAFAFLALVPRLGGWFTRMGAATLVVYLFHGFAVKGADYAGFDDWGADHVALGLTITTVVGLGLSLFLAWRPVSTRLTELVDPFGYAERHARHAVDLGVTVVVHEDHETPVLDQLVDQLVDERSEPALDQLAEQLADDRERN